jgi:GntR family transcriptional regulator / MocR family aminotransferase
VRRRGVESAPRDVLIVNGTQQAVSLAARTLVDPGARVIVEEPCYFGVRQVMQAHGTRLLPARTDAQGLVTHELPARGARLICVTPSHQFPGGSVLSLARRLELLRYAEAHRAWIVEDDYDGEFRYDGRPLAALRSLDTGDRVLYVGSFSKVLFPGLRLGYMVLPTALSRDFAAAKWLADMGSSVIEQAALADFIATGAFERHLRKTTASLRVRRDTLLAGLREHAGEELEVADCPAGMHAVAWFKDCDRAGCEALVTRAHRAGLGLYPIARHYARPPERPGLMFGFAALSAPQLRAALPILADCLAALRRPRGTPLRP